MNRLTYRRTWDVCKGQGRHRGGGEEGEGEEIESE